MDLSTTYLGLHLPHPLVPGASPMANDLDTVRELEDAGAPLITMTSLFEEELRGESLATAHAIETPADQFAEATSYLPPAQYTIGPEEYLDRLFKIKQAVDVPVVASLNGTTTGGWLKYAIEMEQAGADAIELNLYQVAADFARSSQDLENESVEMVRTVRKSLTIPMAVKLSPFYTSLPHFAAQLADAGADALVLFNRFYQPDIDVEQLELQRTLRLSNSWELLVRLRWTAILYQRVKSALAVSGGVHTATDVVKAVMCGASVCQLVSSLLTHGPQHLARLRTDLAQWLEKHEYASLSQMQGSMSLLRCPNPQEYERANYIHILRSWESSLLPGA
jgi:dihydroorotate dehydrogenase (fumarate)